MNNFSKLCFGLLLILTCSQLFAQSALKRVELMKYAIKTESALRHETKWVEVGWFEKIKFIEEAYAYKEGETCLVLGFKSQFKNGMCRLSVAEGIKEYKKECAGGYLPCNPQIFGKPSAVKPFCVSQSSGNELSKSCAKETFNHLAQKSKAPELKDIPAMSAKKFDLDKVDLSKISPELNAEFTAIFKHEDASLDEAVKFTEGLCEDLKISTKSGHQPFDLKTCEGHLALLKKGNVTFSPEKKEEKKEEIDEKSEDVDSDKSSVSHTHPNQTPKKVMEEEEECVEPILDKKTEENIKDVQDVTNQSDATAMMACIQNIEKHKVVAKQLIDIAEFDKERDRYFGFWHQLNGEKQFGRLCENSTEDTAVFSFLGSKGFLGVKVPIAHIKEQVSQVSYNGETYYLVRDMLGDYFELIPKKKLTSAPKEAQEDIRTYHRKGGAGVDAITPIAADKIEDAKACIRGRVDEYADWITYPETILPNAKEYNADVKIYNDSIGSGKDPGDSLRPKYSRTIDEIKKDQFATLMKDVPDCKGILSEEEFSRKFDIDHKDRIKLYNQFRGVLGIK